MGIALAMTHSLWLKIYDIILHKCDEIWQTYTPNYNPCVQDYILAWHTSSDSKFRERLFPPGYNWLNSQRVNYVSADSQLSFKHLFLHQVFHSADLHLVHLIYKAGPIRTAICSFHRLWLARRVNRGCFVMSGGHTVAAITDAEASESGWNARTSEVSSAALAWHRPVVSVDLWMIKSWRMWIHLFGQYQLFYQCRWE